MSSYRDLDIYVLAYNLAKRTHKATLKLPQFELYEQGSQIRRSTKSIRDTITEGYGRRRYKADFIKFLVYANASCDEAVNQASGIIDLYPEIVEFVEIRNELELLGKKINSFTTYVEEKWKPNP